MNSNKNLPDSIDVKIKASHFDFVNTNAVLYTEKAAKKGIPSWIAPYSKPHLVAHDKSRDPIGRIIDSKIVKLKDTNSEPPHYVQLIARITDKNSIEKILDGRYNTVSVGSRSSRVICSECGQVITEEGLCDHKKGSYNEKGEMVYWIIDQLDYTECSFVNEPADEYAHIDEVNYGRGWVNFSNFLDNRSNLLAELKLEDCMSKKTDAKISKEARDKLAEKAFCGPGRSFPAHDEAHVLAGIKLLDNSEFSDDLKAKIKATLYRKGKRYGIVPTKDELQENPDLLTVGIDDEWTSEQLVEITDFFEKNPDADLPEAKDETNQNEDNTDNTDDSVDVKKMKSADLKELVIKLQTQLEDEAKANKDAIDLRDSKIVSLEKKLTDADTLALQREDEVNTYLDEVALLEKRIRDSVISNIIDLKLTDNTNEEREALLEKLSKRQMESLQDALEDLRLSKNTNIINSEGRVSNTTILLDNTNSDDADDANNNDQNNTEEDKFSFFDQDRSQIMED